LKARYWIGAVLSIVFLAVLALRTDLGDTWDDLQAADYRYLTPAVAALLVSIWFRAWRWSAILHPFLSIRIYRLYPYVVIGSMVNNVLPARAGELVRTYVLGERYGVKKMVVLGTVAIDRLFDGLALLAIYVVVAFATDTNELLTYIAVGAALAFGAVSAVFLMAVLKPELSTRFIDFVGSKLPQGFRAPFERSAHLFVTGLQPMRSPRVMAAVMVLSLLAWFGETTMYYILGFAFDLDQPFHVYLLVAAAANLVIALPPSQGGIGPFELVTKEVLVLAGATSSAATAYAVTLHAALLLPVILLGIIFLWVVNLDIGRVLRSEGESSLSEAGSAP
jgi:glycosyltransferase 2 family protein